MPYVDTSKRTYDVSYNDFITQLSDPNSLIYYEKWNRFDDSDIGEAIIKLLAAYSHTVDFYRDYCLNSLYLPNNETDAKEQIYEMLNYKPGLKRSMVLTLNFVWKGCGPIGTVSIPKFFKLSIIADGTEYTFLTMNSYTYLPYAARLYVDVVLGEITENIISVSDITGTKYLVNEADIDSESVSFTVDGKDWTQVRNIYYEKNPGCKFSIHRESDGTYIYLPSDWKDSVPSEISEISIKAAILQEPFDIQTEEAVQVCLIDTLICSLDNDVTDQFNVHIMDTSNSASTSEGGKRRIISLDDYEKEAKAFAGVLDARALNWGDGYDIHIYEPNIVKLVILGEMGNLSSFVKRGLKEYLDSIALKEITLELVDPVLKKVDINLLVNIGNFRETVYQNEIYQAIRDAVIAYMTFGNIGIGKILNISELISVVVRSDKRIKFVDVPNVIAYDPLPNEIPVLGSLYIEFHVEALALYDTGTFIEIGKAGPYGVEEFIYQENIDNLVATFTVTDDFYWDIEFPEAELEKEYVDSYSFNDTATISFIEYEEFNFVENANPAYGFIVSDSLSPTSEISTVDTNPDLSPDGFLSNFRIEQSPDDPFETTSGYLEWEIDFETINCGNDRVACIDVHLVNGDPFVDSHDNLVISAISDHSASGNIPKVGLLPLGQTDLVLKLYLPRNIKTNGIDYDDMIGHDGGTPLITSVDYKVRSIFRT